MTNRQSSGSLEASVAGQNRPSGGRTPIGGSPCPSEASTGACAGPEALPTDGQLLHLVDRAERGVLLPVEAGLLRLGVERLIRELSVAEGRLSAGLSRSPLVVACPFCGAVAGSRCRAVRGVVAPRVPHAARVDAAAARLIGPGDGGEQR